MIKKILSMSFIIFGLIFIYACQEEAPKEIVLPDLTGMTKTEAINALSGLNIQITFDDVVNNNATEGIFSNYGDNLSAGTVVEPNTEVTVYFVIHQIINGVLLPDLTGLNRDGVLDLLFEEDIILRFEDYPTNNVDVGLAVGYANNYQPGMVVNYGTTVTVYLAIEQVFISEGLIISKYVEGTGDNKAIEIANRTTEAITLTDEYFLSLYLNGSEEVSIVIPLTGTIDPLSVLVITHSNAEAGLLALADVTTSELTFDGNDVVAITYRNGAIVDVIGVMGWGFFYIHDETYVRKAGINTNNPVFDLTEWDRYANNNYSMVGSHPTIFPSGFTFNQENLDTPFNLPGGMVLVSYGYANDGDTSEFYSLDENFADFTGGKRVRFVGIDTPEMTAPVQPWAPEATALLRSILENADEIYLMHDPDSGITETYGRTLALVWADGILVNYEMVRMGFSAGMYNDEQQRLIFNGVSLNEWFRRAEQEAKDNNRGIWS
ncbi:MAG: thermonuclease family protein [Acholeplasmataceae bacterium]